MTKVKNATEKGVSIELYSYRYTREYALVIYGYDDSYCTITSMELECLLDVVEQLIEEGVLT